MRKRWGITILGIGFVASGAGLAYLQRGGAASGEPSARNLILISIDTLRADHLSGYGYGRLTSPRLDAFAARGVTFLNAISASAWTVPAHMTLFTGLEPVAHQLIDFPFVGRLGADYVTAAETFLRRGFRTAAFVGGGYMSARHGFDRGFEIFESNGRRFEENLPAARLWIEQREPDGRFFLFLHGFNTHKPYKPPSPYDREFCPDYAGHYDTKDLLPERPRPSPEDLEFVVCQYDGEIRFVDELLGGFLDELEAAGLLKDTLVVITSDHGDEIYEHGKVDHIHTLYDELIRVPLIMVGPGILPKVVRRQVGQIDVFATLFDFLGLADVDLQQSSSLRTLIEQPEPPVSEADESRAVASFTGFSEYPYHLSSIRTDRWKLVMWSLAGMKDVKFESTVTRTGRPMDGGTGNRRGGSFKVALNRERYTYKFRDRDEDFVELFDLQRDPGEQRDVAAENPQVVARLTELLRRRIEESRALTREAAVADAPGPEVLETLRTLGYVADDSEPETQPSDESQ